MRGNQSSDRQAEDLSQPPSGPAPGVRPPTRGFQKPLTGGRVKPVGLAVLTQHESGAITCSCEGFVTAHPRKKVREDRAQRHLDGKHQGRGVWL